jgi:hypothetical protein
MYNPAHCGMGSMMEALTWRPSKLMGATTLGFGIVAAISTSKLDDRRLKGGYQLLYDAPRRLGGDDEGHGGNHIVQDSWQITIVPTVPPRPTVDGSYHPSQTINFMHRNGHQ